MSDQLINDTALVSFNGLNALSKNKEIEGNEPGRKVFWATHPWEEIPIRLSLDPKNPASSPPLTVTQVLDKAVSESPHSQAMAVKIEGIWRTWTYAEYYSDVIQFANSLLHIGVERFQGVTILGFNSPEWFIANLGSIYAGALPAGIYTTNGPEACHYVAAHCGAAVFVVEDEIQLQKVLQIRDRLPTLKAIIQWSGRVPSNVKGVYSWRQFLALGKNIPKKCLQTRISLQRPGHCCTLIYTSGTTGTPKAVMISHDNMSWTAKTAMSRIFAHVNTATQQHRLVSYLPLSHIAAQITDLHGPLTIAACVYFAKPDALKGSLVETLTEVKPTLFLGVPRVWEKIEEKMRAVGAANTGIKKSLGDWAKDIGLQGSRAKLEDKAVPWGWSLADKLVFSNIKKALGLNQSLLNCTAAAPITLKTLEYFQSLDIPIYEVYGMSESTGPHTLNIPGKCKIGTVGKLLDGVEQRLDKMDEKGNGEICMRGRHVFMGYLHNPAATMEAIDEDGWLHSGDIGRLDESGFLSITGRIKELIITAGGENVPPVPIEDSIKHEMPAISNAVVIGDKRKYLAVLLTLKLEPDNDGKPTEKLAQPVLQLLESIGSDATSGQKALLCKKLHMKIDEAIERVNAAAVSRAQHIRKWKLLGGDFSVETGELTPTMKLKRKSVCEKYKLEIESLYEGLEAAHLSRL